MIVCLEYRFNYNCNVEPFILKELKECKVLSELNKKHRASSRVSGYQSSKQWVVIRDQGNIEHREPCSSEICYDIF